MNTPTDHPQSQPALAVEELLQIGLELQAELDLNKLLQKIISYAAGFLKSDMGGLFLCEPDGSQLKMVATANLHSPISELELSPGEGLAGKVWQRIFEPFEQINGSPHMEGTGLGLAISRSLIDLMGGRLEVSSEANVGSIFSFSIPLQLAGNGALDTTMDGSVNQTTAAPDGRHLPFPHTAIPPQADLQHLMNQTMQGDVAALRRTSQQLAQNSRHYQPFIQEIERLTKAFQLNELQKLLMFCLSTVQHHE